MKEDTFISKLMRKWLLTFAVIVVRIAIVQPPLGAIKLFLNKKEGTVGSQ